MKAILTTLLLLLFSLGQAQAGEADVVRVKIYPEADHRFRFEVSVAHQDEGWKHFAKLWEVLAPDGTLLAVRVLQHPHVQEQPFTRSLSGIKIPAGIRQVIVRARDSVHGYGGRAIQVSVPER